MSFAQYWTKKYHQITKVGRDLQEQVAKFQHRIGLGLEKMILLGKIKDLHE